MLQLALLLASAQASWPDDVDLAGMVDQGGVAVVDETALGAAYQTVIRQLGAAVGTRVTLPAATLGATGFELSLDTTASFLDARVDEDDPSPWQRAHVTETPSAQSIQPGIMIRKGLPMSLEVGFGGRWIGQSRQGVLTGFVRAALVEGYKPWPDINLHMGGSGYIGNDQLELGVFDVGVTIGTTAPLGPPKSVRIARLSPFVDATLMVVTASPRLDLATRDTIGAVAYGRRDTDQDPTNNSKALSIPNFSGGLQLEAGTFMFRVSGGYSLKAVPWVGGSVGFRY
ncbi:MAG TPA: hypothetical protein PKA64_13430 [Myxococcota bacterium]|nr:hypothetical protein [Myxococcota bacterium]